MLYCAYGSNINSEQMQRRCPSAEIFDRGELIGYRLVFSKVASVVPDENARTPVLIWKISEADEKRLDVYEGYPHKYSKQMLPVEVCGEVVNIMCYTMNNSAYLQPPSDEYYCRIEQGYSEQGFDTCYLEDAWEEAYEAEYGESMFYDDYYSQCSFWDETFEPKESFDEDIKNAFIIGQAFAKYDDEFSFSDTQRQQVIDSIVSSHKLSSSQLSLDNYADNYFEGLLRWQTKGGLVKDYIKDKEKLLYVAYGTNINLNEMRERCPHSKVVCTSYLEDYELAFKGCADCVQALGKRTPVLVWEIDKRDWDALDRYEGYPSFYDKKQVHLNVNGERKQALMYAMTKSHDKLMIMSDGMYSRIEQGYKQNGMDTRYLEKAKEQARKACSKNALLR